MTNEEYRNLMAVENRVGKILAALDESGCIDKDSFEKVTTFFRSRFECEFAELERQSIGLVPKDLEYGGIGTARQRWTINDMRLLDSLRASGVSVHDIAKKLHRTPIAVAQKIYRTTPLRKNPD